MTRYVRFCLIALLALIAGLTAPAWAPAGALAQDAPPPIDLVPFTNATFGVTGVLPAGWDEASPGLYARRSTAEDLTAIVQWALPGVTTDQLAAALLPSFGLETLPEAVGEYESALVTWDLYTFPVEASGPPLTVDLALAETDPATFVVLLQAGPVEHERLHEAVFLPALDALDVLRWGPDLDSAFAADADAAVPTLALEVVETRPHDPAAFTQGLLWHDGRVYESTGQYGASTLREVDAETGAVLRSAPVPEAYFAEGLERVGERLLQLTWKEQVAFVYDLATFEQVGEYSYQGEGWGLCYDGAYLYMSNGSPIITIRDPETFEIAYRGRVTYQGTPVQRLNELECVGDYIYANVWTTNSIVQIDKRDGRVVAVIDASGLLTPDEAEAADVLNGIAYDAEAETFLITGKHWPKLFEVRFVARDG